jgi:hypothetical protein
MSKGWGSQEITMPDIERHKKVAKEAIDAIEISGEDKDKILAALKDIKEHAEYAIEDSGGAEEDDNDD